MALVNPVSPTFINKGKKKQISYYVNCFSILFSRVDNAGYRYENTRLYN